MSDNRFPSSVYGVGDEPDARFTLANERTFLAWIRTALALIAAGVALEALEVPIHPAWRLAASVLLLLLGLGAALTAWFSWAAVERAVRQGAALPSSRMSLPLTVGVAAVAAALVIGLITR